MPHKITHIIKQKFAAQSIEKLLGDADVRKYYRLKIANKYYILSQNKIDPRFTQMASLLEKEQIHVAHIYQRLVIDQEEFLLLQDLGKEDLSSYLLRNPEMKIKMYKKVIDHLIALQNIDLASANIWANKNQFNEQILFAEVKKSIHWMQKFFHKKFNQQYILQELHTICQQIASYPMLLTHRDLHARNIMIKKDTPYFIDFQDARWGHPLYDLVSLLDDCYFLLTEQEKERLIKYYLARSIFPRSSTHLKNEYQLIATQRLTKVIGTFIKLFYAHKEKYLIYIGIAFNKLNKILSFNNKLHQEILSIYYEH